MPYTLEQLELAIAGLVIEAHMFDNAFPDSTRKIADMLRQAARDARLRQGVEKLVKDSAVAPTGATEIRHQLRALLAETETP